MATIKITKRLADKLGTDGDQNTLWDSIVSGFGLRLRKGGKKYFVLKYRHNNRQRWYTIGAYGSPWTVEKARHEANKLLVAVYDGVDPAAERDHNRNARTVAEQWGLRDEFTNPVRGVRKFPERRCQRFLSDEEISRLGRVLRDAPKLNLADDMSVAAIRLLLFTGCRLSEILTLRWSYVDFQRN